MEKVNFSVREPIGSSTYPMPSDPIHYERHLNQLNLPGYNKNKVTSIYIHIPFCDQICSFCGFNKSVSPEDKKEMYVQALIKEIQLYANQEHIKSLDIQSVYLGGGTPNSLSADQLDKILTALHDCFDCITNCELTCEGTPQNFTDDKAIVLKKHHVHRISAGIQTVNQDIRKEHLHMRNGETELLSYIEKIQNNFDNFNLDFIYNLPGQTVDIWNHDMDVALATNATHLTIYPLVLLERTRFYTDYVKTKKHDVPSQDMELKFFDITLKRMMSSRFVPYTIRDWSLPGKHCRYIQLNAECNQVLAFGAGSHGYIAGMTYRNERNIVEYCKLINQGILPIDNHKICTKSQLMQRYMVMGLRLFNFDLSTFSTRFDTTWQDVYGEKINNLVNSGYLLLDGNKITHTTKGHIWANNIRTYFEEEVEKSVGYSDSLGIDKTGKSHYSTISRIKAAADVEAHS
jgi:oxygen-independent coproporphyrinogen-3 oxidase